MAPEYESHGTYGCSVSRYLTESAIVRQAVLKLAARSKAFNRRERQDSAKFAKKFSASFAQSLALSAFCLRELSRCKLGDEINNRRDFTNSKRDAAVDVTRIAAGDAGLWRDIFLDNADNLRASAERLRHQLDALLERLHPERSEALRAWLDQAARRRQTMPQPQPHNEK